MGPFNEVDHSQSGPNETDLDKMLTEEEMGALVAFLKACQEPMERALKFLSQLLEEPGIEEPPSSADPQ